MPRRPTGAGIGLRHPHLAELAADPGRVRWVEVLVDDILWDDGPLLAAVERLRWDLPIVFHGVGLNLGGTDPLHPDTLDRLAQRVRQLEPAWVSDHACFTRHGRHALHDLLPLPRNAETIRHLAGRIGEVQDRLGRRILVENASAYLGWAATDLEEGAFLAALAEEADCGLLVDVNNLHVTAHNLGGDPLAALEVLPPERVGQLHVAGYEDRGTHLLDSHSRPVQPPVLPLLARARERFPHAPLLLEWDQDIPPLEAVLAELARLEAAAPAPAPGTGTGKRGGPGLPVEIAGRRAARTGSGPGLAALQGALARALLEGAEEVLAHVRPVPGRPPAEQLRAVRAAWRGAHLDVLREAFPACRAWVGEAWFEAAALRYLRAHPPDHPDLGRFGDRLGDFLETFPPARAVPFLPDLARLEWAWDVARRVAPEPPADLVRAADRPLEAQRWRLPRGASRVRSAWAVDEIWEAGREGRPVQPVERPTLLWVGPTPGGPVAVRLEGDDAAVLDALVDHGGLAGALAALAGREPPPDLAAALPRVLGSGRLVPAP